jgi:uracil-DNA glycosylase family 4
MGMSPASNEIKAGTPFHFEGKAGLIYRKILSKGGIDSDSLITLNTIQCRPPGDSFTCPEAIAAIAYCKVHRDKAIGLGRKAIVALGNLPFETLCGESGVESKRGYEYWSLEYECPVIPSIHPSFIEYKKATSLISAVLYDLKIAPQRVPRGPSKMKAIEDPSPEWFREFCRRGMNAEWVVIDIETPHSSSKSEEDLDDDPSSQILRISLAVDSETAVSIPYAPLYIDALANLLAAGMDKIFWNANFDVPRIEYNGLEIGGRIVDAMWLWHFLQPDLPRGLGHVATYYTDLPEWKSKSSSAPAWYSCCDAYATSNIYLGVRRDLESRGMWYLADRDVTELLQVLKRMTKRGICIDLEALERFKKFLENELSKLQSTLNEKAPASIRKFHPKNGYVRTPKDVTGMVQIPFEDSTRWAKPLPFSANSHQQVKDYMRAVGHTVPFSKKESKETTDKKFLQRYSSIYPTYLYGDILMFRKIQKLRGTYASWPISSDGKVRTRFSLAPATGRLSTLNPNTQNIPAEGELADMFRDCLIASPGNLLNRRDYTGAEALLTGYFANDELFMKLSRIGVYTYVLAKHEKIDVNIDAPDLAETLSKIKAKYKNPKEGEYVSPYKKFKTLVIGICYGLGPDQMFEQNPGVFESKGEARKLRRFFFKLFPKIEQFQESAVAEAKTTALVKNPFGYIRWLWDVPGLDGPKAIAQKPQSSLAAIVKRAMLQIDSEPIGDYLILQIHDELVLDAPEKIIDEVDERQREIMEAPIPELGGLIIKTARKLGRSMRG